MPAPSIRIDWQRVALNLRSHGIQLEAASRRLGKHRNWLGQLARAETGQSVEFHAGLRLLDYHLSVCGEAAHLALLSGQQTLTIKEAA
jgi:hypothetical protein